MKSWEWNPCDWISGFIRIKEVWSTLLSQSQHVILCITWPLPNCDNIQKTCYLSWSFTPVSQTILNSSQAPQALLPITISTKSRQKGIEAYYLRIENCCHKILYEVKKRMSEQNKNDEIEIKTKKSGAEKHKRWKVFQRRVLTIGVLKHGKRDGKSHERNEKIKIRRGKKASVASGDTTRLTSTWSVGVSQREAASVGSLQKNNGRKSPKSRKETDTQIKKPNEMESMEGNHIETQIQLSKVKEKKWKQKEKGICHV